MFFRMGRSTLRGNGIMNCWFIRKGESRCCGILLDIRTRRRDAEWTHKETNDGRAGWKEKQCMYLKRIMKHERSYQH